MGAAYTLAGRVAEALPLLAQAVAQAAAQQHMTRQAQRVAWLSAAYLLARRSEEADACAPRARERARAPQERGHEARALRRLGHMAAQADPPEVVQAETPYPQALAWAEELGMRPLVAHCHLGLGRLYVKTGQRQQARAALATAIEMSRAMAMTVWLPQADAALAQVAGRE